MGVFLMIPLWFACLRLKITKMFNMLNIFGKCGWIKPNFSIRLWLKLVIWDTGTGVWDTGTGVWDTGTGVWMCVYIVICRLHYDQCRPFRKTYERWCPKLRVYRRRPPNRQQTADFASYVIVYEQEIISSVWKGYKAISFCCTLHSCSYHLEVIQKYQPHSYLCEV